MSAPSLSAEFMLQQRHACYAAASHYNLVAPAADRHPRPQGASVRHSSGDAEAQRCTAETKDEAAAWSELILADRVILHLEVIQKSAMKVLLVMCSK